MQKISSLIEPVLLGSAYDKSGFVDEMLATREAFYQQ